MAASMIIIIIAEGGGRNEPGALLNIINAARFEQFVNERILELRIVCVAKKNSFTNDLVVLLLCSPRLKAYLNLNPRNSSEHRYDIGRALRAKLKRVIKFHL